MLGAGLTQANVSFAFSGNDLIVTDGTSGDRIDLQYQAYGSPLWGSESYIWKW